VIRLSSVGKSTESAVVDFGEDVFVLVESDSEVEFDRFLSDGLGGAGFEQPK